jgi:hypothetical protein
MLLGSVRNVARSDLEELHKVGELLVGLVDRLLRAVACSRSELQEVHLAAVPDLHLLQGNSHQWRKERFLGVTTPKQWKRHDSEILRRENDRPPIRQRVVC